VIVHCARVRATCGLGCVASQMQRCHRHVIVHCARVRATCGLGCVASQMQRCHRLWQRVRMRTCARLAHSSVAACHAGARAALCAHAACQWSQRRRTRVPATQALLHVRAEARRGPGAAGEDHQQARQGGLRGDAGAGG
jgi:hypothetical protein